MEVKTYVLLKDLPDHPKGTVFVWDASRGKYKTELEAMNGVEPYSCFMKKYVENNPDWFKLKDEKIEVLNFTEIKMLGNGNDKYHYYTAVVKTPIPKEKYDAVKKAIEFVLNNDQYYIKSYPGEKMYSEKELLDAEEKAFEASYELNGFKYKYTSFKDYKNKK